MGINKDYIIESWTRMNFEELRKIENEIEQIKSTYEIFNEDNRLNHSKSARVEFLTNINYIQKYIKPNSKILDIGAGAGEYSLYFAKQGFEICALELADENIKVFKKKISINDKIDLTQGNAIDLSVYSDNEFDIVLLFGPLYHLHNTIDRQKCIEEAQRVCKPNGMIFFAFISNDMVITTEFSFDENWFDGNSYNHNSFKVEDFPFVFFTFQECVDMLQASNINIIHKVASDGLSELLQEKINKFDEYSYNQYLKYHFYICEKPEMVGHSNHLLFVGR